MPVSALQVCAVWNTWRYKRYMQRFGGLKFTLVIDFGYTLALAKPNNSLWSPET
jgi:hypothetical protein